MPYLSRAAREDPVFGEIDAAISPWLYLASAGGPFGCEAIARPLAGPAGETPREARARMLAQAEDAFDALAAAGLELERLPGLEFRPQRDRMELVVWFSVRRGG